MSLDDIRVASPCPASWGEMTGDAKARFCASCRLHVYNLSAMTRSEAETLIERTEGRLCVRFYRRVDGTVLTRDCPIGQRTVVRWLATALGLWLGIVGFLLGSTSPGAVGFLIDARDTEPIKTVCDWLDVPRPAQGLQGIGSK